MAFSKSYRMELVYFERLKSMIDILQPYLKEETDEKLKAILENSIDDNGAILLLYRNLGEAWAELSDLIKKADEKIEQTKEDAEKYHDELNQRIDEVNNYIMALIRCLEETKQDKLTAGDNITIDENNVISAGGGSGGIEFIAFNYDENDNIVCNKTINEIGELLEDKKFCVGVLNPDDEPIYLYVNNYDINQTFGSIIIFKTLTDVDTFISQSKTIVCEQEETGAPGSGDFTDTFYEQYNTQNGTLIISAGDETPVIDPEDAMIIRQNVLNEHIIIKFTKLVDGSGSTFFYHFQSCRQTQNSPYVFMCTDIRNNVVVHHVMEIVIGSGGSNTITLTDY